MADESKQGGGFNLSGYTVPVLLAVLALAGGIAWPTTPLTSLRPAAELRPAAGFERAQTIEARLWQDPLMALELARRNARPNNGTPAPGTAADGSFQPLSLAGMKDLLAHDAADPPPGGDQRPGLQVLLVMVQGGTYAEEAEARLRMREAVVSALSTARYRAEDEERIGAWKIPWPRRVERTPDGEAPLPGRLGPTPPWLAGDAVFPFERFVVRKNADRLPDNPDRTLVVWLPDTLFDEAPLERLANLVAAVRQVYTSPREKLTINILGPVGSDTLRNMLPRQDGPLPESPSEDKPLDGVRMFSYSATAMDELLVDGWQREETRGRVKDYLQRRWGLNFTNTIATDDELSRDLVDELARRGVDLSQPTQHVALLHEWDTFYARSLPVSFAVEVQRRMVYPQAGRVAGLTSAFEDVRHHPEKAGLVSSILPNVHSFTYLRGIDGKVPGDAPDKKAADAARSTPKGDSKDQNRDDHAEANRAEGGNQLDYIPRVALELDALREELRRGGSGRHLRLGELKAIGLMGSDFYDKLLILQALRPHFPGVVFFTTDLDGRFVDPSVKKWTRNLVVASGFGLTLNRRWQGSAAPFRGSYQSSLFLAALEALNFVPEELRRPAPAPRTFEIGRVRAVDLSAAADVHGIHPSHARRIRGWDVLWAALLVLATVWLLVKFVLRLRKLCLPYERQYKRQPPFFFTEEDIFDPAAIIRILPPAGFPLPAALGHRAWLPPMALPRPCRDTRLQVTEWLNGIMRDRTRIPRVANSVRLQRLVGGGGSRRVLPRWLVPRYRRRLRLLQAGTRRLAAQRLELEDLLGRSVGSCQDRCRALSGGLRVAPVLIAVLAAGLLIFLGVMCHSHTRPDGEPFNLLEGVSAWPCEILRMLALVLTVAFAFKGYLNLQTNEVKITENFFLERDRRSPYGRHVRVRAAGWWLRVWERFLAWPPYLWSVPTRYPAITWYGLPGRVDARDLWNKYRDRSRALPRLTRSVGYSAVCLGAYYLIYKLSHEERFIPVRGALARGLDAVLLGLGFALFVLLNFLVADAVRLARTFMRKLIHGDTDWPALLLETERERMGARHATDVVEWLDIQFIGQITECISGLVFYPAIILSLLIVARTHYFDDWQWPWPLVVIFALNSIWPLVSAFLMQKAAAEARTEAVEQLGAKLTTAQANGEGATQIKALEDMLTRIKEYRRGAFTNYLDNPALKALLVPFTGASLLNLINWLTSN